VRARVDNLEHGQSPWITCYDHEQSG